MLPGSNCAARPRLFQIEAEPEHVPQAGAEKGNCPAHPISKDLTVGRQKTPRPRDNSPPSAPDRGRRPGRKNFKIPGQNMALLSLPPLRITPALLPSRPAGRKNNFESKHLQTAAPLAGWFRKSKIFFSFPLFPEKKVGEKNKNGFFPLREKCKKCYKKEKNRR